jgi:rsbT antagonist protein RsbS
MTAENISVIKVRNVLMVTIPSDPDDATVSVLQNKILEAMERHESIGLIIDLASVETLDSFFARTIVETACMVELMGGRTIVAGMRPSVAITAMQMGLSFGRILTALDVERALDMIEGRRSGW